MENLMVNLSVDLLKDDSITERKYTTRNNIRSKPIRWFFNIQGQKKLI